VLLIFIYTVFISMINLWKGVQLGGHKFSYEILQERFVVKPFTVLEYCCLLLHMIIHTKKVELK